MINPQKVFEAIKRSDKPIKIDEATSLLDIDAKETSKATRQRNVFATPRHCRYQPKT